MTSKVFQTLRLFRPEELKTFARWLRSPWCNSQQKLVELWAILQPHYPQFDQSTTSKETLFAKLFPQKEYDAKGMRNLLSALNIAAERFLQHQMLQGDALLQKKLLLQVYQERHQQNRYEKTSQQVIEKLEKQNPKDWPELFSLSQLYEQRHRHVAQTDHQNLYKANHYLDLCYALGKYRFLVELAERNKIVQEQISLHPQIELVAQLATDLSLPALATYQQFLQAPTSVSKARLRQLQNAFAQSVDLVSTTDQSILLLLLLNEAARLHLQGEAKVYETLFDLYKIGLERELFLHYGRLSEATFTNIVAVANLVKATDFVYDFIETYADKLPPEMQEDSRIWGRLYTDYHSGQPTIADMELALAQRNRDQTTFSIRSRMLLLQMYFDDHFRAPQRPPSFLLDYSHAFERQVRRLKNYPPKNKIAFQKAIQYTRKLYQLLIHPTLDLVALNKVAKAIEAEPLLHAKAWLREQAKKIGLQR